MHLCKVICHAYVLGLVVPFHLIHDQLWIVEHRQVLDLKLSGKLKPQEKCFVLGFIVRGFKLKSDILFVHLFIWAFKDESTNSIQAGGVC